jgi:hypothetical protein
MNEILCKFLAKNKYPEVKSEGINLFCDMDPDLADRFDRIHEIEGSRNRDRLDTLVLGWHYLGWGADRSGSGSGSRKDLQKAEHLGNNSLGIEGVLLLILSYLMNDKMSYQTFKSKYTHLLNSIVILNKEGANLEFNIEITYRLFRLMSGWLRDHDEYQLSQDLMTLSEWVGSTENLDPLIVDIMINRWVSEGRTVDLHLIRMVVGEGNQKLNSLLGISSGVSGSGGGGASKRNINLVMRMGK